MTDLSRQPRTKQKKHRNDLLHEVYTAIYDYKEKHKGLSPTLEELATLTTLSNREHTRYYVKELIRIGALLNTKKEGTTLNHYTLPGEQYILPDRLRESTLGRLYKEATPKRKKPKKRKLKPRIKTVRPIPKLTLQHKQRKKSRPQTKGRPVCYHCKKPQRLGNLGSDITLVHVHDVTATVQVMLYRLCMTCRSALRRAKLTTLISVDHPCREQTEYYQDQFKLNVVSKDYTRLRADDDPTVEYDLILPPMALKTYYGVRVKGYLTCTKCKTQVPFEFNVESAASSFITMGKGAQGEYKRQHPGDGE